VIRRFCLAACCLCLLAAGATVPAADVPAALQPEVGAFIDEMVQKHQFPRARLQRLFARVQPRPAVIRAMTAPRTALPWYEFRASHVNSARIENGVRFWRQHAATIGRASAEYGVPEEIIVATVGIETNYGRNTGKLRVLDVLATLAFQYPPRADYFRGELEEYLLLAREAGMDPLEVKGSYAGAIGIPQFLPSSYRSYAVDFNGDGKRDLVGSPADAIGSIANYYRAFGWREGEAAVVRADAGAGPLDTVAAGNIKPEIPVGELRRHGVVPLAPVGDDTAAALFAVESESGPEYWLGLNNFYVITRYNRSVNYAMAVVDLARELRGRIGP
jgi:membrane-bound lytic murein transglycosylase B